MGQRRNHKGNYQVLFFFFFIEFGVTLVNKTYRVQLQNSVICHLYIALCVHCPKSSLLSSPFIPPLASSTSFYLFSLWQSPYCCKMPVTIGFMGKTGEVNFAQIRKNSTYPDNRITTISINWKQKYIPQSEIWNLAKALQ